MERQSPPPGYRLAATPTRAYDCNFRSQLEARWAVFFCCSGIPWQYEPHAVKLPDGRSYLPDFLLWDSVYCEVKPYGNSSEKANAFAVANPQHIVLLLNGLPDYGMFRVLGFSRDWAGFRSNGESLFLREPAEEPPAWSPPAWRGTEEPNVHCYFYLRARGFAHTCNFRNGAVKIPRRVQQTFAWIEGAPQP
jgi:hypothetical protein